MASLFIFVNPNYRPLIPSPSPTRGKGAHHHDHMLQTVRFTAFFAPFSRHTADIFAFSCVRLRFANRTYGFKTGGIYPNRQAAVGCNKRSAVHHEHILIAVQFTSFFAPYSCCLFRGDEPSWRLRHK